MKNRAELHKTVTKILEAGGISDAPLEAQWILEDVQNEEDALEIAKKRANHEPLQYLLGKWEFYGLPLYVGAGVLIPRADTETLVDAILQRVSPQAALQIIDLCTGSGCIGCAVAHELPATRVVCVDISAAALEICRKNTVLNKLSSRVIAMQADAQSSPPMGIGRFDVIVSNPPYISSSEIPSLDHSVKDYEPMWALDGGEDGLIFYRKISGEAPKYLKNGGYLLFEIGDTQGEAVSALMRENGFSNVSVHKDLAGLDRVVEGRLYV